MELSRACGESQFYHDAEWKSDTGQFRSVFDEFDADAPAGIQDGEPHKFGLVQLEQGVIFPALPQVQN